VKRSHIYLAGIALISIAGGAIEQALYARADAVGISLTVTTLPTAILLYLWVNADATEHGFCMPPGATLLVPLIAIVGVPYYLIRTRPRGVALWQVPVAMVCAASLSFMSWGGRLLVYACQRR
jgi:hypothetical protein